ncbi:MAG: tryptophan synthase subunit alpha [Thiotrichales bacterium]|jgi:tryptophan synthase alpha chain|nr:tryptophan synthase subunit alpha [Thiotrichales bacterium]
MNRLETVFADTKAHNRAALIPYITAGDPSPLLTVPLMHTLVDAGADVIELGVPFSDPMADGPVIQRATERALTYNVSLRNVLEMVIDFRRQNQHTPVVLMGYANPIEAMGIEQFAREAASAGVDGVLTVDYPAEEAQPITDALKAQGLANVFLVSPTTPMTREQAILSQASGFIYYVSLRGVTGAALSDLGEVRAKVEGLKAQSSLPIGVGFGIRDAETAKKMAAFADAVVIGSALISEIEAVADKGETMVLSAAYALLSPIRSALQR